MTEINTTRSTLPEGVPSLPWPYDSKGYCLTPGGKRYRRLAWVDPYQGMSVICFIEPTPEGPVYWCADGWKRPRRVYKTGEWERYAPLYEAALAYEQGTGPATYCEPREVPADRYGRVVAEQDAAQLDEVRL